MSWLFGIKTKPPQGDLNFPPPPPPGTSGGQNADGGQNQSAKSSQMEAYRFDSSALERAAQAAKELEKSSKLFCDLHDYILDITLAPLKNQGQLRFCKRFLLGLLKVRLP